MAVKPLAMTYNSSSMVVGLPSQNLCGIEQALLMTMGLGAAANVKGLFDVGLPICKHSQSVDGEVDIVTQISLQPVLNTVGVGRDSQSGGALDLTCMAFE